MFPPAPGPLHQLLPWLRMLFSPLCPLTLPTFSVFVASSPRHLASLELVGSMARRPRRALHERPPGRPPEFRRGWGPAGFCSACAPSPHTTWPTAGPGWEGAEDRRPRIPHRTLHSPTPCSGPFRRRPRGSRPEGRGQGGCSLPRVSRVRGEMFRCQSRRAPHPHSPPWPQQGPCLAGRLGLVLAPRAPGAGRSGPPAISLLLPAAGTGSLRTHPGPTGTWARTPPPSCPPHPLWTPGSGSEDRSASLEEAATVAGTSPQPVPIR